MSFDIFAEGNIFPMSAVTSCCIYNQPPQPAGYCTVLKPELAGAVSCPSTCHRHLSSVEHSLIGYVPEVCIFFFYLKLYWALILLSLALF